MSKPYVNSSQHSIFFPPWGNVFPCQPSISIYLATIEGTIEDTIECFVEDAVEDHK